MKCTCKLKAKLKIAEEQKRKYEDKCRRINKIIANREGKKLRLVTWVYKGETTMYVVYQAEPSVILGNGDRVNIGFVDEGNLHFYPYNGGVEAHWREEGGKLSTDSVTYYDKQYRINKKFQLCEVVKTGCFKKVTREIVIKDLREVLGLAN